MNLFSSTIKELVLDSFPRLTKNVPNELHNVFQLLFKNIFYKGFFT